jgi:phosphoribosylaminoimidazole carboxylase PurK protein
MAQKTKIGIVGGGQLAMMMTQAAQNLGITITVIDPTPNCPAALVGASQILADYNDANAIKELSELTDVITIDFEHVNCVALQELVDDGKSVCPEPGTILMIQDKLIQCEFLDLHDLPVADFKELDSLEAAKKALDLFDGKMLLKARHQSYDGKGNAVVTAKNLETAWNSFSNVKLYAEAFIPFVKEIAVILARDLKGNTVLYPTVETIHINNICHKVFLPGDLTDAVREKAENIALATAEHLGGAGVFAIEMFLTKDNGILINEIAPRVHNSGHPTIEGSVTSQFEQHLRAVSGMQLGSSDMKHNAAVMINLLGIRNGTADARGVENAMAIDGVTVHMYGKHEVKIGRKMGHLTAVADTLEEASSRAEQAFDLIEI